MLEDVPGQCKHKKRYKTNVECSQFVPLSFIYLLDVCSGFSLLCMAKFLDVLAKRRLEFWIGSLYSLLPAQCDAVCAALVHVFSFACVFVCVPMPMSTMLRLGLIKVARWQQGAFRFYPQSLLSLLTSLYSPYFRAAPSLSLSLSNSILSSPYFAGIRSVINSYTWIHFDGNRFN